MVDAMGFGSDLRRVQHSHWSMPLGSGLPRSGLGLGLQLSIFLL